MNRRSAIEIVGYDGVSESGQVTRVVTGSAG